MKVTIIREDDAVYVDGVAHTVDCSTLAPEVHAVQWDGVRGEVEYRVTRCDHCGARTKKGNEIISDFTPYQKYVDAWQVVKSEADAAAAKGAEELAATVAEQAKAAEAAAASRLASSAGAADAAG